MPPAPALPPLASSTPRQCGRAASSATTRSPSSQRRGSTSSPSQQETSRKPTSSARWATSFGAMPRAVRLRQTSPTSSPLALPSRTPRRPPTLSPRQRPRELGRSCRGCRPRQPHMSVQTQAFCFNTVPSSYACSSRPSYRCKRAWCCKTGRSCSARPDACSRCRSRPRSSPGPWQCSRRTGPRSSSAPFALHPPSRAHTQG
mmetsp:Transcript_18387/g.71039  ORF Transcript_18387/g.71039 Transcript_18387/m.71039 type:complete len:202 (-) Transcript_18387:243-848(-)